MSKDYWRRVHKRALADTIKALRLDSREQLVIKVIVIIAALACLALWGSADASRDELIARAAIAGILVLLFPFVYIWKFLGAPARLEAENKASHLASIDDLNIRMDRISERLDAMPDPELLLVGERERVSLVIRNSGTDATFTVKIDYSGTTQHGLPETPVFAQWADGSTAEQKRIEAGSRDRALDLPHRI
jgi:hypothetical protein